MLTYEFNQKDGVMEVYPVGILDFHSIKTYFETVIQDDNIPGGILERVHFEKLEDIAVSFKESLVLSETYRKIVEDKIFIETRFLVKDELSYGMARMFQSIWADIGHKISIEDAVTGQELS